MLDYNILTAKPYIKLPYEFENNSNTTLCKDLFSKVLDYSKISVFDCKVVEVTKDYIARPDLISLAVYGTDKYADIICKINGISNPFELNTGMILFIPDLTNIQTICSQGKISSTIDDGQHITNVEKTNQKQKRESRSPAEQVVGESTFIIDRTNKIVYY
jgi:hypothetical protein